MCGRYSISKTRLDNLESATGAELGEVQARYNVAPGTDCPITIQSEQGPILRALRWGLIPHWSKEPQTTYSTINAKAETVAKKPTYRDAFKQRRCLVPATGYYEWKKTGDRKQPYHIHCGGQDFAFAGVWDHWEGEEAEPFNSFSIITTAASDSVKDIHIRMPVILPDSSLQDWLDPDLGRDAALELLAVPVSELESYPVSTRVNNPRNEGGELLKPA